MKKYEVKQGKHGPIWTVAKGVKVSTTVYGTFELCVWHAGERTRRYFSDLDRALRAAELVAVKLGLDVSGKDITYTLSDAARDWLANNRHRWAASTVERYTGLLSSFILPVLGAQPLVRIGRNDVKKLLVNVYMIRSAKTAELCHAVMSGIFSEAIDNGYTSENPCSGILGKVLPSKRKRRNRIPNPFTAWELREVLSEARRHLPERVYLPIAVMAMTGMRLGEALAMHVDHLDIANAQYMITETVRKGRRGTPKTGARLVDLPGALVQELEAYILRLRKEAMRNGCMVGYLFDGVTERMVQRGLERACTAAKVRRRHPHDLRHTYATLLLMSHMSPAYVQKQLGHSSITMTVDIYGHWIPGQGRRNLDEIFSPGGGNRRAPSRAFNDVFRTSEG